MNRFVYTLLPTLLAAGLSACVTATDRRAELITLFRDQVRSCYLLPEEAKDGEAAVLEIRLNADGSLAQAPKLVRGVPDSLNVKAAMEAVSRCTPLTIPAAFAHRHAEWKVMIIGFEPQ